MARIMSLDSGTTSVRALIFDENGQTLGMSQEEIHQIYPHTGWVEEDPNEIWDKQIKAAEGVLEKLELKAEEVDAIGITNQRETLVAWDKRTGEPVYNAIVWQCRRTEEYCEQLVQRGLTEWFQKKTGLVLDAYFSATKIGWVLKHVDGAREMALEGNLLFGTIDTWLIWKATGGKSFVTDYSNACRTMLFNIHTLDWDDEILEFFGIPKHCLPKVKESGSNFGTLSADWLGHEIPILAVLGDQQSALFGQCCFNRSDAKCTYGTGAFILANIGEEPIESKEGLLTTVAWGYKGKVNYAFEGSIFMAGATIQWLRDNLGVIKTAGESEKLATSVESSEGVYFVSTFQGLGAPWWKNRCRASIHGMSRKTNVNHIVRAALESICFRVKDVIGAMEREMGMPCKTLRVDGGMTANNFMMQCQSDILQIPVSKGSNQEVTAMGAAFMAGLMCGVWEDPEDLKKLDQDETLFRAQMPVKESNKLYEGWLDLIQKM